MLELADVLREHLQDDGIMANSEQMKVLQRIVACRTEELGGSVFYCEDCAKYIYSNHSCNDRNCPKCQTGLGKEWAEVQHKRLLPVSYFHLVVTVPQELHSVCRRHPQECYNILMKCASKSVLELCADPKHLGAYTGIIAVLHTWTRALLYHPHVHMLVPAGGTDEQGLWIDGNPEFLIPIHALSKLFRGKVRSALRRKGLLAEVPLKAWDKKWVTYSKPAPKGDSKTVLDYLGRYIRRVAICNSRILEITPERVVYQYTDHKKGRCTAQLTPVEFINRFSQHILPTGFHKVRYYGLFASANKTKLQVIRDGLFKDKDEPDDVPEMIPESNTTYIHHCPYCSGKSVHFKRLIRKSTPRAPP